ncbi:MAG: DUF2950 domain-containing protein [Bacillota bacterium]
MNTSHRKRLQDPMATLAITCLLVLLVQGCAHDHGVEPQSFQSPDDAVQALTNAFRADDTNQLMTIVGSDGRDIVSSGDETADRQRRQKFLTLYDQKHSLVNDGPDKVTLVIGNSDWPFPVPMTREAKGWVFDSEAGREEILNRRIGENELSAIQVCKAIADAQREYALRDPDGDGVHEYAQKFASDPDKRNGLYWPTAPGEEPSPLGALAAHAAAEGYARKEQGPTPYHGYYYRILRAQGPHAPNGELSYMVNGKMILGFAVVAYPADYDNSGIMTFIMGPDGVVYQKDLGEKTAEVAGTMQTFDPDKRWRTVE